MMDRFSSHIILLLVLYLGLQQSLSAQVIIPHTHRISALETDINGRVVIIDEQDRQYNLQDYGLRELSDTRADQNAEETGYRITDGRLIKYSGKNFSYEPLGIEAQAFVDMGDYLMVSTSEDIYIWNRHQLRKLYIPQLKFPKNVIEMTNSGSYIAMRTEENSLAVYDTLHQILKRIDDPAEALVFDKWRCLWYSYSNRLYHSNSYLNEEPPILSEIRVVDASDKEIQSPYVLSENADNYRLLFSAQYGPYMDDLSYSFRKEGEDWRPLGKNTSVRLDGLTAGQHRYWIRAHGHGDAHAVSLPIDIIVEGTNLTKYLPWLLGLLAGLLAIAIIGRIRLRGEMATLEREKERIKMQLALAGEKQKLGQAQMNPHFIFNVLNSISGLIALQQPKVARAALKTFSTMMRQVLDTSRSESVTVAQEVSFLKDYLKLEAMIRQDSFEFTISNEADDSQNIPPMIIQPFIENAIIHGVHGLDRKGNIQVDIVEDNKYVEVRIEDNGRGRKKTLAMKKDGHNSAAIDIVQQRLRSLDKWEENHLTYHDLSNDSGEPMGTKVELRLPKIAPR